MQPHGLALDSQGRLFVADRGNNRVQVVTTDGKFVADWPQFSRPSGVAVDRNDMFYSADSESGSVNPDHKAWVRGIRIGSAKDGKVLYFIPDPAETDTQGTLAAEGVAVDSAGNIYGAEVGPTPGRQVRPKEGQLTRFQGFRFQVSGFRCEVTGIRFRVKSLLMPVACLVAALAVPLDAINLQLSSGRHRPGAHHRPRPRVVSGRGFHAAYINSSTRPPSRRASRSSRSSGGWCSSPKIGFVRGDRAFAYSCACGGASGQTVEQSCVGVGAAPFPSAEHLHQRAARRGHSRRCERRGGVRRRVEGAAFSR